MIGEGLAWAWGALQPQVIDAASDIAKRRISKGAEVAVERSAATWRRFNWASAEQKYRLKLLELVQSTRVLGYSKLIDIDQIYTDVFILDKLSAQRRYTESLDEDEFNVQQNLEQRIRLDAKSVVGESRRLFILGRPGAGKTTFLKHLAMNACKGLDSSTPIFVSLKEWSDSSKPLIKYIAGQFAICDFPNSDVFINTILEAGKAHVLLDGLDEVNEWQDKRAQVIRDIVDFSKKYNKCRYALTCRTAATDYSFERFEYVEIADFTQAQQLQFARNWYGKSSKEFLLFSKAWGDEKNAGFRDLGKTPLLLTLLCLAFDENHAFPKRQVDVYQEAIYALLKKWDSSRLISRDNFYKNLSPIQRTQLLETVAAKFYFSSKTVFRKQEISHQVSRFVDHLPDVGPGCDGAEVVRQIEAQHGLLVERAKDIFTFSHLTIQEYFAASYISKNQDGNLQRQIIRSALSDQKWREVILYTVALLPNADSFFEEMLRQLLQLKQSNVGALIFLGHCFCIANIEQLSQRFLDAETRNAGWIDVRKNFSVYARAIRIQGFSSNKQRDEELAKFLNQRWQQADSSVLFDQGSSSEYVFTKDSLQKLKDDLSVVEKYVRSDATVYAYLNEDLGVALKSISENYREEIPWIELLIKINDYVFGVRQPSLSFAELSKFREHVGVLHDFLGARRETQQYARSYLVINAAVGFLKDGSLNVGRLLGGYFTKNEDFIHFFYACRLMMECIEIAITSRRAKYLNDVLMLSAADISKIEAGIQSLPR